MNIIGDDPIAEMVKNIIQPSVEGLQNRFDSDYMPDDLQYSKELENEDCYQVEMLEEENLNAVTWAEWTPAKLSSEKSKELQFSNNNENNDGTDNSLSFEDIETFCTQSSSKKNCDPPTNNSSQPNLKRKKSKQLEVTSSKQNEQFYDLAQSKLELVELMKENFCKISPIQISIYQKQLEKEKLYVEILKKQLKFYEK
ncbi:uncharacterized protein LOC126849651 isoform X1 [Cataglyphis hispanica]|uniref:uncharacterized protein LOC126849651 isoform X1 n=1 Tax=Cataglyphis hispanica TaxID=1086592 RepID=UPI0021800F7B|nr:uncharacterized protein LOC126849651 isoform X1 [Cataglyphis hispanica]XP_050447636.1 uncharacterized protein LOC126849651 isoform X1 [Cataglyphis hispanica]XP_050447637.1 uncharacterized protein LOC126849651 isoform X1 [Cataglyphis hispanica]